MQILELALFLPQFAARQLGSRQSKSNKCANLAGFWKMCCERMRFRCDSRYSVSEVQVAPSLALSLTSTGSCILQVSHDVKCLSETLVTGRNEGSDLTGGPGWFRRRIIRAVSMATR